MFAAKEGTTCKECGIHGQLHEKGHSRLTHPQVALISVKNRWGLSVEGALELHDRVVNSGLEVRMLRIHHQPHIVLRATSR